jgi:hypothetical protein
LSIVVQENWSGRSLSLVPPWVAVREFTVTGTTDQSEALVAEGIPQRDEEHPENAELTCEGPKVTRVLGPEFFVITCEYTIDEKDEDDGDPLNKRAEINWEKGVITEQVDRDLDNLVICDSGGFRYPNVSRDMYFKILRVQFNQPYYDPALSVNYENAVNHAALTVAGYQVAIQHMRCVDIGPNGPYSPGDRYVSMMATFEIFFTSFLGAYPFQHRFLDQGETGWYEGDGGRGGNALESGKFINATDKSLAGNVRLNGSGKPLPLTGGNNILVGETGQTPQEPPSPAAAYKTEFYDANGTIQGITSANASTQAVFRYFKKARVLNLSPLLVLLNNSLRTP